MRGIGKAAVIEGDAQLRVAPEYSLERGQLMPQDRGDHVDTEFDSLLPDRKRAGVVQL